MKWLLNGWMKGIKKEGREEKREEWRKGKKRINASAVTWQGDRNMKGVNKGYLF